MIQKYMAKKYLKGEINEAKAQQEWVTTEMNVDSQPTNKETKENQTEVHLAQNLQKLQSILPRFYCKSR